MKALTIRQPYAQLVVMGRKQIETRPWRTAYRGPLLIHAGQRAFPGADASMPRSAVIGRVILIDVVPVETLSALSAYERSVGDYSPGRWAWLLAQPEQWPDPIPAHGRLGLWEWEAGTRMPT